MGKNIGKNIVRGREINGISQKYLAHQIGITKQGLLKIEKGVSSPKAETLEKIMHELCLTPNQIFGIERIVEDDRNIIERLSVLVKE